MRIALAIIGGLVILAALVGYARSIWRSRRAEDDGRGAGGDPTMSPGGDG